MYKISFLFPLTIPLIILKISSLFGAESVKHKFIAIDEGLGNLIYINQFDSTTNWRVPINKSAPRDMQLIGNNRILIGHTKGFTEYDIKTGSIKHEMLGFDSVTSVRRLSNGQTIVVGINLDRSRGIVMLRLDVSNKIIKKIVYSGNYVRLFRQTLNGTFLFACNDTIKEADTSGAFIRKIYLSGNPKKNKHIWKAVRLDNGNILVSGGYGAFMAEINNQGNVIRKFGASPQPSGVNPYFYAMFQLLPNGNCAVANWQGHGPGNGNKGIEALEFNSSGTIIWQWNNPALVSSLQGILILDDLNTDILHDDRNGIMTPLENGTPIMQKIHNSTSTLSTRNVWDNLSHCIVTLNGRAVRKTSYSPLQISAPGIYIATDRGSFIVNDACKNSVSKVP